MVTGTAKGISGEKKSAGREETVACEGGQLRSPRHNVLLGRGKVLLLLLVSGSPSFFFLPDFPGMGSNYVS